MQILSVDLMPPVGCCANSIGPMLGLGARLGGACSMGWSLSMKAFSNQRRRHDGFLMMWNITVKKNCIFCKWNLTWPCLKLFKVHLPCRWWLQRRAVESTPDWTGKVDTSSSQKRPRWLNWIRDICRSFHRDYMGFWPCKIVGFCDRFLRFASLSRVGRHLTAHIEALHVWHCSWLFLLSKATVSPIVSPFIVVVFASGHQKFMKFPCHHVNSLSKQGSKPSALPTM